MSTETTAMTTAWSEPAGSEANKDTALNFRFRSDAGRIPAAIDQVMSLIRLSGCVRGQEIQVELALHEALHNAVVHGNRRNPEKLVHVRCACDPGLGVSIVVRDEGRGFDPGLVEETATHRGLVLQGRGLLIMRSYMDLVWFEKGGTEVHLWKNSAQRALFLSPSRTAQVSAPLFAPAFAGAS